MASSGLIPIEVQVKTPFLITPELRDKLKTACRDLVRENLSDILAKSFSSNVEANVKRKTQRGFIVEAAVICLFKETYTAWASKVEFAYEDDQVTMLKVERSSQPC